MSDRLVLMVIIMGLGIVFLVLGVPLAQRRVPPNRVYGFRLPAIMKDPDLWYAANALAGRWLLGIGAVLMLATPALYFAPIGDDAFAITLAVGLGASVFAMSATCMAWLANRLRRGGPPRRT